MLDISNSYTGLSSIMLSFDGLRMQTVPSQNMNPRLGEIPYHSDSSNDLKSNTDDDYSVAVQSFIENLIRPTLAWNLEVSANLSGYGASNPQLSSAIKIITNRHTSATVV